VLIVGSQRLTTIAAVIMITDRRLAIETVIGVAPSVGLLWLIKR
jgi:hypothetical protein